MQRDQPAAHPWTVEPASVLRSRVAPGSEHPETVLSLEPTALEALG